MLARRQQRLSQQLMKSLCFARHSWWKWQQKESVVVCFLACVWVCASYKNPAVCNYYPKSPECFNTARKSSLQCYKEKLNKTFPAKTCFSNTCGVISCALWHLRGKKKSQILSWAEPQCCMLQLCVSSKREQKTRLFSSGILHRVRCDETFIYCKLDKMMKCFLSPSLFLSPIRNCLLFHQCFDCMLLLTLFSLQWSHF